MPLMVLLLAGLGAPAQAKRSTYRVTGISPIPGGAELAVSYDNDWGPKTKDNTKVTFWIYPDGAQDKLLKSSWTAKPPYHKPGAVRVATLDWQGVQMTKVALPYDKLGLKPGQEVLTGATWDASNHVHGDICPGRLAGGPWTLPAPAAGAKPNSALCRVRGLPRGLPRRLPARVRFRR